MKSCVAMAVLLLGSSANAQQESLTLDWAFSDERRSLESVPNRTWLHDGRALIYDRRVDASERTLEFLNPGNGRRRGAVNRSAVLATLTEHFEPEEPYEELGWPDAVDKTGNWVAYLMSGDLVLVQLGSSNVVFVTDTDAGEDAAHFAPDGSAISYVRDNDLFVWNIESREEKRLTTDGSEVILNGTVSWVYWEELLGRTDRGYYWSPDSQSIAYLQTDESQVGVMHYVDFEPQTPNVIKQRHPKPGTANPKVRAGVVSIESASTRWIDLGSYPYEYLPRIQWLPDSQSVAVQTLDRAQQRLDLFFADAQTGTAVHIFREQSDSWLNIHDDLHFLDGDRFLWVSERSGFAHAYLYTMDGELLEQVTSGDWSMRPSGGPGGYSRSVAHIDEDNDWLYFTGQEESSIERHLYRIGLDGSQLMRLTGQAGSHSILFNPNGENYFDAWSAIDTPPSLELRDAAGELVATVVDSPDLLERFDLNRWELTEIELDDGFQMPAAILRPRGFDATRQYPIVMYVYGGPAAPTVRNGWGGGGRGYYHQLLADAGFIVVYVDNRSASAKGHKYTSQILHDAWGELELTELMSAVRWLKDRPYVDPARVGIWGWSGGGTHTIQAMTSNDEFYAGVSVAPVTDWDYYDAIYAERFMKRPEDNPEGYAATSHVDRAEDLSGRLMLIHGTYDDNVHPQNTWAFANELIEHGIMFEMMIYPMRKHSISDDAAQRHVYETMLEFWERSLN